jgi:uncharacterized protein with PQ loop repeat
MQGYTMFVLEWLTPHCEVIGWLATSLSTVSFLVKREIKMLGIQLLATSLWCFYGVLIGKTPLIVANLLVAGGASFKLIRLSLRKKICNVPTPA